MEEVNVRENLGFERFERMMNSGGIHVNPLYLSNSDHPGMQLVATQFNGSNFHSWSRGIRMALGAKMKLGFINGGCVKPSEVDDDYDRWLRCDYMVTSWIINSMKAEIAENFMYVQSAKELWDEVLERFLESNAPLVYQIQKQISEIRQENSSVSQYYGKRKRAWDELQALEAPPACTCGAMKDCTCLILKKLVEKEATTKLMQFLMGLSDAYEHIRSNILSMDPLPSLNRAFHMVLQIERQKEITGSLNQNHELLAAGRMMSSSQGKSADFKKDYKKAKLERTCSYCKEKGHVKETCFKLVGIPDWYKGPKGKPGDKFVANVQEFAEIDHPLEVENHGKGTADFDLEKLDEDSHLVNAVVAKVLRAMKGKSQVEETAGYGQQGYVNFAGHFN